MKVVDNTYNEIITWRKNVSKLPSGKAPNNNIDSQAIALKLFIVLPSLNAAFYNISHKQLKPSQFPEKNSGDSGMTHFVEITQAPLPYSMLQYIGK